MGGRRVLIIMIILILVMIIRATARSLNTNYVPSSMLSTLAINQWVLLLFTFVS